LRDGLIARLLLIALLCGTLFVFWEYCFRWLGFPAEYRDIGRWGVVVASTAMYAEFSAFVLEAMLLQRLAQPLRAFLPVGRLVGLLLLWHFGLARLETLLVLDLALHLVTIAVGEWMVYRSVKDVADSSAVSSSPADTWRFAWHMSGAQFFATASNTGLIRILASRVLGVDGAALFSFLQQLSLQITRLLPSTQFANVIRPILVSRFQLGEAATVASAGGFLCKLNLVVAVPILVGAFVGGDGLLTLLSGKPADTSHLALFLAMFIPPAIAIENIASNLIQVYRRASVVRNLAVLALVVPVCVWLLGQLGLCGVLGGLAIGLSLQAGATLFVATKIEAGVDFDRATAMKIILLGAAVSAPVIFIRPSAHWLVWCVLCVGVYLLMFLLWLKWISPNEFSAIRLLLGKPLKPLARYVGASKS
jgi:O-antigen/teichoic acid export membrane protein